MDYGTKNSLFNFKRPPILLIGSGIVKRYTKDSCTWLELLRSVAKDIGIDKARFRAFESEAERNCDEKIGPLPRIASELKTYTNKELIAGNLNISDILDAEDYEQYMESTDPDVIKFLVASKLKKMEIVDSGEYLQELTFFKKLPDIVPCVITTNFDKFIEEEIFDNKYPVYSRVSDYYLSGSQGIGEIYKIHGTVDMPESMILNEEDYKQFFDRSKIVSAKILSILCDYPMVIMGYSMNDPDVIRIIDDLIVSLDKDKLAELKRNIICIERVEDQTDFEWADLYYDLGDKRVEIRTLKTDNFVTIFEELSGMIPGKSPIEIRRFKQLVKKIVASTDPNSEVYYGLGIEDITPENKNKLVIAVGDRRSLKKYSKLITFDSHTLLNDIFYGTNELCPEDVVNTFLHSRIRMDEYIPLFHYLRMMTQDPSEYPNSILIFVKTKKDQFKKKLDNRIVTNKILKEEYALDTLFDEKVQHYTKPLLVMRYYRDGEIDEDEAIGLLKNMYEYAKKADDRNINFDGNLRCAVSYLAYRDMELRGVFDNI